LVGVPPKVRQIIKRLKRDGWVQVRQSGSHRQFQHPIFPVTITVSGNEAEDMRKGTLNPICEKAGWK
jgi:predicted RNA binding protein YcfA (HicA-like mRNA interferase family)